MSELVYGEEFQKNGGVYIVQDARYSAYGQALKLNAVSKYAPKVNEAADSDTYTVVCKGYPDLTFKKGTEFPAKWVSGSGE